MGDSRRDDDEEGDERVDLPNPPVRLRKRTTLTGLDEGEIEESLRLVEEDWGDVESDADLALDSKSLAVHGMRPAVEVEPRSPPVPSPGPALEDTTGPGFAAIDHAELKRRGNRWGVVAAAIAVAVAMGSAFALYRIGAVGSIDEQAPSEQVVNAVGEERQEIAPVAESERERFEPELVTEPLGGQRTQRGDAARDDQAAKKRKKATRRKARPRVRDDRSTAADDDSAFLKRSTLNPFEDGD